MSTHVSEKKKEDSACEFADYGNNGAASRWVWSARELNRRRKTHCVRDSTAVEAAMRVGRVAVGGRWWAHCRDEEGGVPLCATLQTWVSIAGRASRIKT